MKSLNEFLNEANNPLKPNDKVSYYVPDLIAPASMGNNFYNKSEEDQAKELLIHYKLVAKNDIKNITLSNIKESPNGNLEFTISGIYKVLKTAIEELAKGYDMSVQELINDGTIKVG